jgi:hypothetical protein
MKIITALIFAVFAIPMAFANNDAANKMENTVDSSKNPFTGTVTVTKKHKRKVKDGKSYAQVETTEKTKFKKNGEVDKSIEVNGDSAHKPNQ